MQNLVALRYMPEKGYIDRVYAMIADTANHLTINATGDEAPFNSSFTLVTTGNRRTEEIIRKGLLNSGYQEATYNVQGIAADLVNMGLEASADQFNFLLRVALVEDEEEASRYWE